jgi:hypothetical protein
LGQKRAVEQSGSSFAIMAIFPGDSAQVTFDDLNRETANASLESNYVGPLLLAKALGEAMERGENGGGARPRITVNLNLNIFDFNQADYRCPSIPDF